MDGMVVMCVWGGGGGWGGAVKTAEDGREWEPEDEQWDTELHTTGHSATG